MAGFRWPPEDSDAIQARAAASTATPPVASGDLISDDDRSIAADSWSIKSDYGSTLDDEQRHVDAAEALSTSAYPAASDYGSDKEEPDANEVEPSMLGLQSYWDATYAEDLANFQEHGHAGEVWFGSEVMDSVVTWTKNLCINLPCGENADDDVSCKSESSEELARDLSSWNVLDIGTGNGVLLQELKKQGFTDLTGTDYSEAAIDLARSLAVRNGYADVNYLVDDVLDTKLEKQFKLVLDKGTFDAIGLHPDGAMRRIMYWDSVSKLVAPGGIVVITSCNHSKDELVQEVENFNNQRNSCPRDTEQETTSSSPVFEYIDNIRTYPTIMFGGVEGSRVATVAFRHN